MTVAVAAVLITLLLVVVWLGWAVVITWAGWGISYTYGTPKISFGNALLISPLFVGLSGATAAGKS